MDTSGKNKKHIVYALDQVDNYIDLEKIFYKYENVLHSIKFNSVYHQVGSNNLVLLSQRYQIPLFYDLKIYDTPNTVYSTIQHLPKEVKYVTVTYAHNNRASLEAARQAAIDFDKKLFVVSVLTSTNTTIKYLEETYHSMCQEVSDLNLDWSNKLGVVIPTSYITIAKDYNITTLTPGLVVEENQQAGYKNQVSVGTLQEAYELGGDLFVLGRNMPTSKEDVIKLEDTLGVEDIFTRR